MSFRDYLDKEINEAATAIYDETRNLVTAGGKNAYAFQVEWDEKAKEYYGVFQPDPEDDEDVEEINTKKIADVVKFLKKEGAKEKNIEAELKKITKG